MSNLLLKNERMKKKILLVDSSINKRDSVGITLSNLFGNWSKENIFMIGEKKRLVHSIDLGYRNFYFLTDVEKNHLFPFGFMRILLKCLKSKSESEFINREIFNNESLRKDNFKIRFFLLNGFKYLGFDHYFLRRFLSSDLKKWIVDVNPDYIYSVPSTRHDLLFLIQINKVFNIPIVIHLMDNWPDVVGKGTFFGSYWNRKINAELREVLLFSKINIAISRQMAIYYKDKFNVSWEVFHNVVDLFEWNKFVFARDLNVSNKIFRIGYFGRIGTANDEVISSFISILNKSFISDCLIEFHIFTDKSNMSLDIFDSDIVKVHDFIVGDDYKLTLCSFDLLLLPLSFNVRDLEFSIHSFPTKFPEYLCSRVPILIIAPRETAVFNFSRFNKCAYLMNEFNYISLKLMIESIIFDKEYYKLISETAGKVALKYFDSSKIQLRFEQIF